MTATDQIIAHLREVATVQPGYLSRGRVRSAVKGTHLLIQARDVSPATGIRTEGATRFVPERKAELYQINEGDVLVVARGQEHRAHHVDQRLENALAAATFYILRPRPDAIRSGYLAWWLNLPSVQAAIAGSARGTSIPYVSREAIEGLRIPLPPAPTQQCIERVVALWRKKLSLQHQLDAKREDYIQALCERAMNRFEEQQR
ncbi:hypothetical protein BURK2_01547 [Burkholderiales bacterium]|nr:hypothetical protein BURK2_01547 [Burkholderiales bacterium]